MPRGSPCLRLTCLALTAVVLQGCQSLLYTKQKELEFRDLLISEVRLGRLRVYAQDCSVTVAGLRIEDDDQTDPDVFYLSMTDPLRSRSVTIKEDGEGEFGFVFRPQDPKPYEADLLLTVTGGKTRGFPVKLRGRGVAQIGKIEIIRPSPWRVLDFGRVQVEKTSEDSFVVRNLRGYRDTLDVHLLALDLGGGGFSIPQAPTKIVDHADSFKVNILFSPLTDKKYVSFAVVRSRDRRHKAAFRLEGEGVWR